MSYTINNTPITHWGLRAGVIGASLTGYALSGAWSLPKRLGDTHRNWQGEVEPYVLAEDLRFDGRDLTLNLVCTASNAAERHDQIAAFQNELPDQFTLTHPILGSFQVGLTQMEVHYYGQSWAGLTLKLRETQPTIGTVLPPKDEGAQGIDERSWSSLGFVVEAIEGNDKLGAWQPLSITTDTTKDTWKPGSRAPKELEIKGTIRGANYTEFKARVEALQALLSAPGVRRITGTDGATVEAFSIDGFEVEVFNFHPVHWGKLTCKMMVL